MPRAGPGRPSREGPQARRQLAEAGRHRIGGRAAEGRIRPLAQRLDGDAEARHQPVEIARGRAVHRVVKERHTSGPKRIPIELLGQRLEVGLGQREHADRPARPGGHRVPPSARRDRLDLPDEAVGEGRARGVEELEPVVGRGIVARRQHEARGEATVGQGMRHGGRRRAVGGEPGREPFFLQDRRRDLRHRPTREARVPADQDAATPLFRPKPVGDRARQDAQAGKGDLFAEHAPPAARPESDGRGILARPATPPTTGRHRLSRSFRSSASATTRGTNSSMLAPKRTSSFSREELT
jgi:hypothetical protein